MQKYNICTKNNDTYNGVQFTVTVNSTPLNLEDALIRMEARVSPLCPVVIDLSVGNGITIVDATNGVFKIDQQIFSITPGTYCYDIQITLKSGVVKTYISGKFIVSADISRG